MLKNEYGQNSIADFRDYKKNHDTLHYSLG